MLQCVATIASVSIAVGVLALIAGMLADDWRTVVGALRLDRSIRMASLPERVRQVDGDRRVRIIRVSAQSSPWRAAA